MPHYMIAGRDSARGLELRKAHREAHLANLRPLAEAGREEEASAVFAEGERIARAVRDEWLRESALSDLAAALARAGRHVEAREKARGIANDVFRESALRDLAAALAGAGRFDEAEGAARVIRPGGVKASALSALAIAQGVSAARFAQEGLTGRAVGEAIAAERVRQLEAMRPNR